MKKIILIGTVIILLGFFGYIFVVQKSANQKPLQPSPITTFDANDNLDQALKDLDAID